MKQEEDKFTGLPENAFRELKPGEMYNPLMSPKKTYPEVNLWSVAWGIAMASSFLGCRSLSGTKSRTSIRSCHPHRHHSSRSIRRSQTQKCTRRKRHYPIHRRLLRRHRGRSHLHTACPLYPAGKYPDMSVTFMQVFISSLLGGVLGILFLIPFRKYFVSDMHGKYPFPEATATTQVLVSGEKGGSYTKPLLMAGLIGGLYDFIVATFGWWNENFTTRVCGVGEMLTDKAKLVFKVNTGAAVLGLGYIVGLKYASIICFGSLVSMVDHRTGHVTLLR